MDELRLNEAPPKGFSYIYLVKFFCDNGKPFMTYVGKTDGPVEARIGKRLTDSYYESGESYNTPVHKLVRLMGQQNMETSILALVRTEYADQVEHLMILSYKNISTNVSNLSNNSIDVSETSYHPFLLRVDPYTYRPIDSFLSLNDVVDEHGYMLYDLQLAIEDKSVFENSLWIWSNDFEVPDNKRNIYPKNMKEFSNKYSVKNDILNCFKVREREVAAAK